MTVAVGLYTHFIITIYGEYRNTSLTMPLFSSEYLSGIIYFILFSDVAADAIMKQVGIAEGKLVKMEIKELITGVSGIVIGLIIANLIGVAS